MALLLIFGYYFLIVNNFAQKEKIYDKILDEALAYIRTSVFFVLNVYSRIYKMPNIMENEKEIVSDNYLTRKRGSMISNSCFMELARVPVFQSIGRN